jgi:hypothetical protein
MLFDNIHNTNIGSKQVEGLFVSPLNTSTHTESVLDPTISLVTLHEKQMEVGTTNFITHHKFGM